MVDESDRIWINLDSLHKAVSDHCQRITKLEQTHYEANKAKNWHLALILAGIAISEFAVILVTVIL